MAITLAIPENYGYTVLIALGAIPVLAIAQGAVVTTLRKKAKVLYPNPYATAEQAKSNPAAHKFNCAQRAHGNLLENLPQTVALLLFNGLFYPRATPALGLGWVLFRSIYAYGYITSDKPDGKGRSYGGAFWLTQLALIGMAITTGLKMI